MKYLVNKGFIDKKGYIMYDKEYRATLGSFHNIKIQTLGKNKSNLSNYILRSSINKYLLTDRLRTKEKIPK